MKIQEKKVQEELAKHYSNKGYVVKREVATPIGIIDLILYKDMGLASYQKILIEVKEYKGLKHALGQLISYEKYHKDCTGLGIIYFTRDGQYKGVDTTFQTDQLQKIDPRLKIAYIGNLIDVNLLQNTKSNDIKLDIIDTDNANLSFITVVEDNEYLNLNVQVENIQW